MVGLLPFLDREDDLTKISERILERTKALFRDNAAGTFTGRGNTKADIQERIGLYSLMIDLALKN
jgi:hypothetical protein